MGCCMSINPAPPSAIRGTIPTPTPTTSNEECNENPLFDIQTSTAPAKHKPDTSIKIVVTTPMTPMHNIASSNCSQMTSMTHSWDMSSIVSQLDLTLDEKIVAFQIKMQFHETEQKLEREAIHQRRDEIFETQLKQQQSQQLDKLYTVFTRHATNGKLDMDAFVNALAVFGLMVDFDPALAQLVFHKFDIDNENEIDFFDFSSTMSELITSHEEEELLLLFQIFDLNKDGYLDYVDIARILLTQNHFAVVATAQDQKNLTQITYTKRQCLKQAKRRMQSNGLVDYNKISFVQFKQMMLGKTEKDMMIQWMDYPSASVVIEPPEVSQEKHDVIVRA
eukprot:200885_1